MYLICTVARTHHWLQAIIGMERRLGPMRWCETPKAMQQTLGLSCPIGTGRRMQRFLQFRLASHVLPIVTGRLSGGQHVDRGTCSLWRPTLGLSIADELHMVYECPALQPLRQRYAPLFPTQTDSMRCFFAQNDHMQITSKFSLHCLDFLNI